MEGKGKDGGKDPSVSLCRLRTGGSKAVQIDTETGPLKKPKQTLGSTLLLMVVASPPYDPVSPVVHSSSRIAQGLGSAGPEARETICLPSLPPAQSLPCAHPTLLHIKSCKHGYGHGPEQQ